ncbi:glycosyltransferase family 2 protein [Winogradskyella sp. A3E31]|uniref:glycosyltransferase family 2 protein n=1 Tax=Winogradskyella sp. A3E31 TaxID=3349637 RepID=UPI00398AA364
MLFKLLTYVQPTHYFGIQRLDGTTIYPNPKELPAPHRKAPHKPPEFRSSEAQAYDQSWKALYQGYIGDVPTISEISEVPLEDEYRFLRTQVHPIWVVYTYLLRLLSWHHPIKELKAFRRSRGIKRQDLYKHPIQHPDYEDYTSTLINTPPLVSIIIPTLNRYQYLKDVLHDIDAQDYKNIELIVVDQSEPFNPQFYDQFKTEIQLVRQEEKALWLARNTAIKQAKGEYLLFFDDDSRVASNWISEHLKALDYFKADISSGVSISQVGDNVPKHYAYFKISDQLDTGNVLIKKEVFKTIGLFDRQFEMQRMGDGEFGCRAYLHGYRNVSNPHAQRLHLKVGSGGLRSMGAWDAFRTKYLWQPRPIPSVLYYFRRYYGKKRTVLAILKTVPLAIMPYKYKGNAVITFAGLLLLVFIWPIVVFQVARSWHLASQKLKEGPLIEPL